MFDLLSILAALVASATPPENLPPPQESTPVTASPLESQSLTDAPLTWETLPEPLRALLDPQVGKPIPQAVVFVDAAAVSDAGTRRVDHGTVVSEQTIRPAAFASIVTPARNARKYGPAGALLWRGVSETGDWWCWRNDDHFPNWRLPSDIYCYRDADGDGDFDQVMENSGANNGLIFHSRYQFRALGHDERLRDPVAYQASASPTDPDRYAEKIVVRYDGPSSGQVQADGRLTDGVIIFELLTGAGVTTSTPPRRGNALVRVIPGPPDDGLSEIDKLFVTLDSEGRGRLSDARGIVLEVDRVDVDGSAQIRLISGVTLGETLLFPPPTRETFLEMIQKMRDERAKASQ